MNPRWRAIGWVGVLTVVVAALSIAVLSSRDEPTNSERALDLSEQFACPVCEGQSVAQSDSPAATAIRSEIAKRVDQGQTDAQITDYLIGNFNESISLKPRASGVVGLVWITPVVALVTAVAGLIVVFRRWHLAEVAEASDADRLMVERGEGKAGGEGAPMNAGGRVPDADQGPLEEQRDFLLRSLDDLEREHEAGDIDETDYEALRDDYTVRAAAVLRSLDAHAALQTEPAGPKRRIVVWTVGIVAFAVLAGIAVAFTSGRRDTGTLASGDPARGASESIARADQLMSEDKLEEAIAAYTKALESQPSNVRALTYRGWLYFQTDDLPKAWTDLDAAVKIDATFPDAHVFRSIMFTRDTKWSDAYVEYKAIDVDSAPPDVVQLLVGSRLQERILAALVGPKLLVTNPPALAASGFTGEEVRLAADQLAEEGRVLDALNLLELVMIANPNDTKAISTRGWINGRVGQQLIDANKAAEGQRQLVTARQLLDDAVKLDPKYLPARVYRAFVALAMNLPKDADADLKVYETATNQSVDMQLLVGQSGLREAIDKALKG